LHDRLGGVRKRELAAIGVVLDEVYRYAYEATLRATSRTYVGAQHPTFHYDLRGRGQLVLTRPRAHRGVRAELSFPADVGFLLLRGSADGPVVVELERQALSRTLTAEPGRYYVRGRGADALYEDSIDAHAGVSQQVQLAELEKIDYARYVRKRGGGSSGFAHGVELGMSMRTALPNSSSACLGVFAGYAIDWSGLGARARFSSCAGQLENQLLTASVIANDVSVQVYRAWDVSLFTFELGLGAGVSLFTQTFETRGRAAPQTAVAPFASLGTSVEANFGDGWYSRVGVAVENHWLSMVDNIHEPAETRAALALRGTLRAGKHV
jgi:hypothetical protein